MTRITVDIKVSELTPIEDVGGHVDSAEVDIDRDIGKVAVGLKFEGLVVDARHFFSVVGYAGGVVEGWLGGGLRVLFGGAERGHFRAAVREYGAVFLFLFD
jgi:hypothetical protein